MQRSAGRASANHCTRRDGARITRPQRCGLLERHAPEPQPRGETTNRPARSAVVGAVVSTLLLGALRVIFDSTVRYTG